MRILIVSTHPPIPCGIGAYAVQQAAALRRSGHVVDFHSPPEANADFGANIVGGLRPLKLAGIMWAYDEVYLHYVPNFFYASTGRVGRLVTSCALIVLSILFGRKMRWIIHETDYRVDQPEAGYRSRRWLDRFYWARAAKIILHSEREKDAFIRRFHLERRADRIEVVEHDRDFIAHANLSKEDARAELGLPAGKTLFLCIGFVQPHKGFDRALRAMGRVKSADAMLRIVGSVRIAWQPAIDYARELHEACKADPRSDFVEQFVSDELFDTWIAASDYVIVPYHEIWTSGVAARARLHGRPVIVSDTGALGEQMNEGSHKFKTDEELAAVLKKIMGEA